MLIPRKEYHLWAQAWTVFSALGRAHFCSHRWTAIHKYYPRVSAPKLMKVHIGNSQYWRYKMSAQFFELVIHEGITVLAPKNRKHEDTRKLLPSVLHSFYIPTMVLHQEYIKWMLEITRISHQILQVYAHLQNCGQFVHNMIVECIVDQKSTAIHYFNIVYRQPGKNSCRTRMQISYCSQNFRGDIVSTGDHISNCHAQILIEEGMVCHAPNLERHGRHPVPHSARAYHSITLNSRGVTRNLGQ